MRRTALLLAALALVFACRGGREPLSGPADPTSLRRVGSGELVGFAHREGGHAWLGIPFAKPPVGELRWRAPRPAEPWEGTLEALHFGARCVQPAGPVTRDSGVREGRPTGSEDCLTLNVFAPSFAPDEVPMGDRRLPVMVWIHGGGNSVGDARPYDAGLLATGRDVIVVTLQYRLGVLGWLSHPALRGEGTSADDASGNYGTLDLVRALEWVRDEIAAFGGDPARVTVFGESAGAVNVFGLLLSPRAAGLFQRAIVQSGIPRTHSLAEAEHYADADEPGHARSSRELLLGLLQNERRAEDRGAARTVLEQMSDTEVASYLRSRDLDALFDFVDGEMLGGMYDWPYLVREGHVLPRAEPLAALSAGHYNRVPVILGTNRDESKLFQMFVSPHVGHFLKLPVRIKDARAYDLHAEYGSNMWKAKGVDEPAAAMRPVQGPSVFAYRFDWDDEPDLLWLDMGRLLGAAHAVELPFVFGEPGMFTEAMFDDANREHDLALSRAITSYWTRFAATGNPGRGRDDELPLWEPWSPGDGHKYVLLDSERDAGIRMGSEPVTSAGLVAAALSDPRFENVEQRCAVLSDYTVWDRALTPEEYTRIGDGLCADHPLKGNPL